MPSSCKHAELEPVHDQAARKFLYSKYSIMLLASIAVFHIHIPEQPPHILVLAVLEADLVLRHPAVVHEPAHVQADGHACAAAVAQQVVKLRAPHTQAAIDGKYQ